MTTWHHKPTWPDDRKSHETDRMVFYGEDDVGRIMRINGGPQDGRWRWSGIWVGYDAGGTVETLQEGLEAMREAYIHMLETEPKRCEYPKASAHYRERRVIPPRQS